MSWRSQHAHEIQWVVCFDGPPTGSLGSEPGPSPVSKRQTKEDELITPFKILRRLHAPCPALYTEGGRQSTCETPNEQALSTEIKAGTPATFCGM